MTSVFAVSCTLPDMTAKGRATTKIAEPTSVAAKQPGRTSVRSPTISRELFPGGARDVDAAKLNASRHKRKRILFFMVGIVSVTVNLLV